MPHDDKAKAAMKGLKNAGVDTQIAERTKINQIMSGQATPMSSEGLDLKEWEKAKQKYGIKGARTSDIQLPVSLEELMDRARAIK